MWDLIVSVPDHCLSFYFSSPASFPRSYKAAPTSRVFSRRHAATGTLQCKTELDVHSALLVMRFSHLLFEISLVNQNSHVTHVQ